jgi:hypothetical protein
MTQTGYRFDANRFAELLIAKSYPEKTDHESALLRDYLQQHLAEFDGVEFSVRIAPSVTPDPAHLAGVQRQALLNSMNRIDMVGYMGQTPVLVEVKTTIGHAVMGQLLMDRALWIAEHPDGQEPQLVAVGRRGSERDVAVLVEHGISVYLYDASDG